MDKCNQCGKPMDRQGYYCSKCNTMNNSLKNSNSNFKIKQGICPNCGGSLDRKGYCCTKCYEKIKSSMKILRRERRKNGLCSQCGKPSETYKCKDCRGTKVEKK